MTLTQCAYLVENNPDIQQITLVSYLYKTTQTYNKIIVSRRFFLCGSFMLFLSCFCYALMHVSLLMPCGHLLRKGWSLLSCLLCLIMKVLPSHWYPGLGLVLVCIDSWSLPSFLLSLPTYMKTIQTYNKMTYFANHPGIQQIDFNSVCLPS